MKRIISLALVFLLLFTTISFAGTNETAVMHDLGEFKIIAEKYPVATPHATIAYSYKDYGVIDKDGNMILEQKYETILPPSEGRAAFMLEGKIGYFDENWNVCIENKYYCNSYPLENRILFSEGLATVAKKDPARYMVYGYIDRDGNEVVDFIYDYTENFKNGVARVGINEYVYNLNTKTKWGKIDKEGNIVEDFKFGYATGNDYEYFWQDPIEVQLSQNLVELNGVRYKNSDIEYPFINYLGYTYFPLTYYGCRMLGINCDWTAEEGVMLSGGGVPSKDIIGKNGMKEGVFHKATFYKGNVTINGVVYEYGDTAYPLIHFKNIVYMPVLWQTGMEALGIEYNFIGAEYIENSDRGCMVFKTK